MIFKEGKRFRYAPSFNKKCNRTLKNPELYVKHIQKKHDKFGLT